MDKAQSEGIDSEFQQEQEQEQGPSDRDEHFKERWTRRARDESQKSSGQVSP